MKLPDIIRNAIQTPDGTILESRHRHDCAIHKDSVTGETYMTDGGRDYLRRSTNVVPAKDLSVTTADPFDVQRWAFTWTTYGKDGRQAPRVIKLCDMSNSHITAILETQRHIDNTYVKQLFKQELKHRIQNNIYIQDTDYE